jgi:hypothetical protein
MSFLNQSWFQSQKVVGAFQLSDSIPEVPEKTTKKGKQKQAELA